MRRGCLVVFFLLVAAVVSLAEDQEKAIKQLRMITAMSRDETARSIVSRTFADVFKLERPQLIAERKSMGLNYGTLFLVHELTLSGSNMAQVATQFRQHNNMFEIANASGADWKRIAADAKNGKPLWQFNTSQRWKAGPMTYTIDGQQYIAVAAGSTILAFGLW